MEKLYGVFNREDVLLLVVVDKVDDSRKGCRFAASRRSRDEDKALFKERQFLENPGR